MEQKARIVVAGDKKITLRVNRYPIPAERNISNSDDFYSIGISTRVNGEVLDPGFLERAIGGEKLYRELVFDKSKEDFCLREADEFEKEEMAETGRFYSYGLLLSGWGLGIDGLSKTEKMEDFLLNELEAFLLKHTEKLASEPLYIPQEKIIEKASDKNLAVVGQTGSGSKLAIKYLVSELVRNNQKVVMISQMSETVVFTEKLGGNNISPDMLEASDLTGGLINLQFNDLCFGNNGGLLDRLIELMDTLASAGYKYIVLYESRSFINELNFNQFSAFIRAANEHNIYVHIRMNSINEDLTVTQLKELNKFFPTKIVFNTADLDEVLDMSISLYSGESILIDMDKNSKGRIKFRFSNEQFYLFDEDQPLKVTLAEKIQILKGAIPSFEKQLKDLKDDYKRCRTNAGVLTMASKIYEVEGICKMQRKR